MDSCVGYAWRYVELRAKQNAQPAPARRHTFFVEPEEDDQSMLRSMKEVPVHYKELLPVPTNATDLRQTQARRSQILRMGADCGTIVTSTTVQLSRQQMRQSTETSMTAMANAFSDLDAIAEMGAGADEHDRESQLSGQNTPGSAPNFGEIGQQQSLAGPSGQQCFDPRMVRMGQLGMGMHPSPQQMMEQQQRINMAIYKQQNVQPIPGSYRMMGPTTSHTGPEVFDFDDSGVTMGSPSYNSPGGVRRRGRGRRGGTNLGDRQLSISSLENDSTPASPSESGPGKKRGSVPGQRKPRKPRKPENGGEPTASFEQRQLLQFQQGPFPPQLQQAGQQQSSYTASPTEEEHIRSRMVSAYEDYKSSTSDDEEMDPPPPPRNLQLDSAPDKVPSTESQLADRKMSSTGQPQSKMSAASDCSAAGQLVKSEISDQKQSQYQKESVTLDYQQHQQQAAILREMKLTYASSSSSSSASSPALAAAVQQQQFFEQQISNAVESRKLSNKPNMDETTTMSMELKPNAQRSGNANNPFSDLYDNQLDTKKEILEANREGKQPSSETQQQKWLQQASKESKKRSSEDTGGSGRKPGKIVLKIKSPRDVASQAASMTTKHSCSTSPSSTSSSLSNSAPAQVQAATEAQPLARLSSSGAPPTKSKQQSIQQQQRHSLKRSAEMPGPEEATKQKKSKKSGGDGKQSSPTPRSSGGNGKGGKQAKDQKTSSQSQQKKEPPLLLGQIAPSPFPTLKNFKIPKVVDPPEPGPAQSSSSTANQQQQQKTPTDFYGEKEGNSSNRKPIPDSGGGGAPSSHRRHGSDKSSSQQQKPNVWEKGAPSGSNSTPLPFPGQQSHRQQQQQRTQKSAKHGPTPLPADGNRVKKYGSGPGPNERPHGGSKSSAPPNGRIGQYPHQQQQAQQLPARDNCLPTQSAAFAQQQNWQQPFGSNLPSVFPQTFGGNQQPNNQRPPVWPQNVQGVQRLQQQQQMFRHEQPTQFPAEQQQIHPPSFNQQPYKQQQTVDTKTEERNDNSPSGDGLQIVDEE